MNKKIKKKLKLSKKSENSNCQSNDQLLTMNHHHSHHQGTYKFLVRKRKMKQYNHENVQTTVSKV